MCPARFNAKTCDVQTVLDSVCRLLCGWMTFDQAKTENPNDKIQRNKKDTIVLTISFGIFASKHALLFSFFKYPIHIILSFSHPYLNP